MKIYDNHTHLNDKPFAGKEADYIQKARDLDVVGMNCVGQDPEMNLGALELAKRFANVKAIIGYCPLAPHLMFPQFLNDNDPEQRILGITLGVEQMKVCDEIWIFGGRISNGMAFELEKAKELGIPVRLYDDDGNRISPATMMIDDRVSEDYRNAIRGLKFV